MIQLFILFFFLNINSIIANPRIFVHVNVPTSFPYWSTGDIIQLKHDNSDATYIVSTVQTTDDTHIFFLRNSNGTDENQRLFFKKNQLSKIENVANKKIFYARFNETNNLKQGNKYKYCGSIWDVISVKAEYTQDEQFLANTSNLILKKYNFFSEENAVLHAERSEFKTYEEPITKKYYWVRIAATTATSLGCLYLFYKKFAQNVYSSGTY